MERRERVTAIFGDVQAKHVAVVGIGGGGDIVSTIPICLELERRGASVLPGGLTWKRRAHDPLHRPREIHEFENVHAIGSTLAIGRADMALSDGVRHVEAFVSECLGNREVLIIDPSRGSAAIARDLEALKDRHGVDEIIGVDAGGDMLCLGSEPTLESPLCDQTLIHALSCLDSKVVLASLGTDGEIQPAEFLSRFRQLCADGAYCGAFEPHGEDLIPWRRIVDGGHTESSRHAIEVFSALAPERADVLRALLGSDPVRAAEELLTAPKRLPLRGGARSGYLSELTAFYLFFEARAVWSSGSFSALWRPEAPLREMHETLTAQGITTEFSSA